MYGANADNQFHHGIRDVTMTFVEEDIALLVLDDSNGIDLATAEREQQRQRMERMGVQSHFHTVWVDRT